MRALLQRVTHASVTVDEQIVGQIGQGLLVLLGVGRDDSNRMSEQQDGHPLSVSFESSISRTPIFGLRRLFSASLEASGLPFPGVKAGRIGQPSPAGTEAVGRIGVRVGAEPALQRVRRSGENGGIRAQISRHARDRGCTRASRCRIG